MPEPGFPLGRAMFQQELAKRLVSIERLCKKWNVPLALGVHASILCPLWVMREVAGGVITGRH